MSKNKLILALSLIAVLFIMAFFGAQLFFIRNNIDLSPDKLKIIFGVGFLIISVCSSTFLIIAKLRKMNLPASVEVNLFELFLATVAIGVASFFLIFKK